MNYPGVPWAVIVDDTGGPFSGWPFVIGDEEFDGCIVHREGFVGEYHGDLSCKDAVRVAHLIAAAPEMYEALKAAEDGDPAFVKLLRAAIAKAEGRS